MYKLIKLTRLVRIFKIFKSKGTLFKKAKGKLNIGDNFEKFVFFILMSSLICHIIACMWVFITTFAEEDEASWISDISGSNITKYMNTMYFTITTITTVGYGDILASNPKEQGFC